MNKSLKSLLTLSVLAFSLSACAGLKQDVKKIEDAKKCPMAQQMEKVRADVASVEKEVTSLAETAKTEKMKNNLKKASKSLAKASKELDKCAKMCETKVEDAAEKPSKHKKKHHAEKAKDIK